MASMHRCIVLTTRSNMSNFCWVPNHHLMFVSNCKKTKKKMNEMRHYNCHNIEDNLENQTRLPFIRKRRERISSNSLVRTFTGEQYLFLFLADDNETRDRRGKEEEVNGGEWGLAAGTVNKEKNKAKLGLI